MNEEYKTSEAQRKAVRKWTEEHKERKKELDRLHNIRRRERIKKGHQELMKLQNNWNELKKWLEEEVKENDNTIKKCDQVIFKMGNEHKKDTHQHKLIDVCSRESLVFNRILNKMQELEQGK